MDGNELRRAAPTKHFVPCGFHMLATPHAEATSAPKPFSASSKHKGFRRGYRSESRVHQARHCMLLKRLLQKKQPSGSCVRTTPFAKLTSHTIKLASSSQANSVFTLLCFRPGEPVGRQRTWPRCSHKTVRSMRVSHASNSTCRGHFSAKAVFS